MPLRISEKIPYAANFWTHPPPPGGVWDKPLEALCRQENLLVTFSHGTNPYDKLTMVGRRHHHPGPAPGKGAEGQSNGW